MLVSLLLGVASRSSVIGLGPTNPLITYIGRWDRSNPSQAACQWTDSAFRVMVAGDNLTVTFDETGGDFWEVRVDGKPVTVLTLKQGQNDYPISWTPEQPVSTVELEKRTEPFVGTTRLTGVGTTATFRPSHPLKRHLEFVGDSITCGYGDEGKNQNEHFSGATENGTETYAALAGRDLKADVTVLAWSGRKMWPDNTVPEIYDRILPTVADSNYDFKGPAPDAVIINLATNDFGRGNPDQTGWVNAYAAFIRRVWGHYPKAQIYCVAGGMMSDQYPAGQNALTALNGYLKVLAQQMNDRRVHLLEFDQQRMEDGIGADWHPNLTTHQKMATKLEAALRHDLKWR